MFFMIVFVMSHLNKRHSRQSCQAKYEQSCKQCHRTFDCTHYFFLGKAIKRPKNVKTNVVTCTTNNNGFTAGS